MRRPALNPTTFFGILIVAAMLYSATGFFSRLHAEGSDLVGVVTDNNFTDEVQKSSKPVLLDFWATWCGPCRMFGPIVDQVADQYKGRLKVARVDVDQNPQLSQAFAIRAIPTSVLFKNGKVVKMWVGLVSGDDLKVEVNKVVKKKASRKAAAL